MENTKSAEGNVSPRPRKNREGFKIDKRTRANPEEKQMQGGQCASDEWTWGCFKKAEEESLLRRRKGADQGKGNRGIQSRCT